MVTYNHNIYGSDYSYSYKGYSSQNFMGVYKKSNGDKIFCGRLPNKQARDVYMDAINYKEPSTFDKILPFLPTVIGACLSIVGIVLTSGTSSSEGGKFKAKDVTGITTLDNMDTEIVNNKKSVKEYTDGVDKIIGYTSCKDDANGILQCAVADESTLASLNDEQLVECYNKLNSMYISCEEKIFEQFPDDTAFNALDTTEKAKMIKKVCSYLVNRAEKHSKEYPKVINKNLETLAKTANMKEKPEITTNQDGTKSVKLKDGKEIIVKYDDEGNIESVTVKGTAKDGTSKSMKFGEISIGIDDDYEIDQGNDYNFDKIKEMAEAIFGKAETTEEE